MSETKAAADQEQQVQYDEVIVSRGLKVPFVPEIITPAIERPLRSGRYEAGERMHLESLLERDDRVLDLGAGLGLIAATAAKLVPDGQVLSIEAQPNLLPIVHETWRLNSVSNADLRHGLVAARGGPPSTFYIRRDFWASSFEPDSRPYERVAQVETLGLADLLNEFQPTIICCDIEGAEDRLFEKADLKGVRAIVIETHPKIYGTDRRDELIRDIEELGFDARPQKRPSTVYVLDRRIGAEMVKPPPRPQNQRPRVLLATCMKNEGPFVLEWLAWHKAIGVTDFVVFTNDCSDGTDVLLDKLDELGIVTHLPNPALVAKRTNFQPLALRYVASMPVFRRADYFISSDVDEFINVHVGDGTLDDLFRAVEPFDVLSMSELNHGANGHLRYARGWITETFPRHDTPHPGNRRAKLGVKSVTRMSERIESVHNHRPVISEFTQQPVWLDGSGNRVTDLSEDPALRGIDCRGRRELVTLEHFPLRSLESYLVKMHRGDVVVEGRRVSNRYWRQRNRNQHCNDDLSQGIALAREVHKEFEQDEELMRLHDRCCAAHEKQISNLLNDPHYMGRRAELLEISSQMQEGWKSAENVARE